MIELGILLLIVVLVYKGGSALSSMFIGVEQNVQDWTEEQVVETGLNRNERLKRIEKELGDRETVSHKDVLDKFGIK